MQTICKTQCTCSTGAAAKFQDSVYGTGVRVHNVAEKSRLPNSNQLTIKCTVCGTVKTVSKSKLA